MRGLDDNLEGNLRSFCEQNYPTYQILFGVENERDPSVPIIRKVLADFPGKPFELVICGEHDGMNRKINNLRAMLPKASYQTLVLADSDVYVQPDYLESIVEPLWDEKVGLVCCPYYWRAPRNVPAALEALTFRAEFIPSVLLIERLQGLRFALGATMVLRRSCLDEIGGFEAIQDYLADDYMLGMLLRQHGHKIVLSHYGVDLFHYEIGWTRLMLHQIRLVRTYRVCRPIGFFFSLFTHGTTWATLFLVLQGGSIVAWLTWFAMLLARLSTTLIPLVYGRRDRRTVCFLWLLPIRDLLASFWWLLAYTSNRVRWRGRVFALTRDGKLRNV